MSTRFAASSKKIPLSVIIAWLCMPLLAIAFRPAEREFFHSWQTEEYSHGPFIPVIALLLAWHSLIHARVGARPSWLGVFAVVLGALLLFVTNLSAFNMTAQYGLVMAMTGVALGCFGKRVTWIIAPALIYLIFAIPLPHLIQADLSQRLQLISSTMGVWPLDVAGIPVFQEGNVIDLGGMRLQVVEACSGLRYLFPLMSFGYLVAVLLKDSFWKRAVIFLSTIPISIILNSLRITVIGITVDLWGKGMAEGFIHTFEGWTVFLICLAILMAETWLLMRIGHKHGRFRYDYIALPRGPVFSSYEAKRGPAIAVLIACFLLSGYSHTEITKVPEIVPPHPPLAGFPTEVGDWNGRQAKIGDDVLTALNLSDYWMADYVKPGDPAPINFYIAYYDSQTVGTTTHSPSNCIPGGGWQITSSGVVTETLADGTKLDVTRLIIRKDHEASLVYYWFDERGRDLTETYYAKWYLLLDSIMLHRTDGALVRLVTPIQDGTAEDLSDERLKQFLDTSYPLIKSFIPGANLAKNGFIP